MRMYYDKQAEQKEAIAVLLQSILGEDWIDNPHFKETPERVRRAFTELLGENFTETEPPTMTMFPSTRVTHEMVFKGPLYTTSMCPHHLLPYRLEAFFAYVPDKNIVGISKPGRLLEWCANRLVVQESLGDHFIDVFNGKVTPLGTILLLKGYHSCEQFRGAKQRDSVTVTTHGTGVFSMVCKCNENTSCRKTHVNRYREEFFQLMALEGGSR